MKKILLIVADGFEEVEALGSADFLRRVGFTVTVAGLEKIACTGSHGIKISADTTLATVAACDFDAVILPGGLPGSTHLLESDLVESILLRQHAAGRLIAAICAAPIVLAQAGLLAKRRFTMYPAEALFRYLGTPRPTGSMVEIDGNIITGKGPGATFKFAAAIAAALGAPEAANQELKAMFAN